MRRYVALALLIEAMAVGAAWLVARLAPSPPRPRSMAQADDLPRPGPTGPPQKVIDPVELARLAGLRQAREQYAALREAYSEGRPSAASLARLEPAVATLWPAPARADVACRGLVCRVLPRPAPANWQAALADSDGVHALTERVAVDPDASTTPAYLLLAATRSEEPAPRDPAPRELAVAPSPPPSSLNPVVAVREEPAPPPADDRSPPPRAEEFLQVLEGVVRASPEVAACLAEAEAGAAAELHLAVEDGTLTSRLDDGLGAQPARCMATALTAILSAPVPPGLAAGARTFRLERP